ncbi:MAG: phosphatidylserine/phosphatidylglycerophosphate/cardiolipin synthase family protein [Kiritimatiellaceae bacterium]|nr:phosphatidylserine/phosphatidylglycerophosphate/cardiolipin synthase family protein [Kiritimatiellaceae bacterium]
MIIDTHPVASDRKKYRKLSCGVALVILCCTGCSTTSRELTYDNTVHVAQNPLSKTYALGWRIKTFWTEEAVSLWRRNISLRCLRFKDAPELTTVPEVMDRQIMAGWLERKAGPPVAGDAQLILNGDAFFPLFEKAIMGATNQIHLKTYLFDNDDVAKSIADVLKLRSRDINIRILYDSTGTRLSWNANAPSLPTNYTYEVYDMIRYLGKDSRITLRRANHTFFTSEHSKYFLIDQHTAFFGGMNIGREYRYDWRDAMFELQGPVVNELELHFENAWVIAEGGTPKATRTPTTNSVQGGDLYLIQTTPLKAHIYAGQLRAIRNAKQSIYIENPYLWNTSIVYALCAARKRGVDVRVTIPSAVNHNIGISANKQTVQRLLDHGVRVFIYTGMTHVKAAVYDQWACFGSANFDDLSLHKNYELNIFTDNHAIVRQIKQDLLEGGQRASTEIYTAEELSFLEMLTARMAQYL